MESVRTAGPRAGEPRGCSGDGQGGPPPPGGQVAAAGGFDHHVTKPADPQVLAALIAAAKRDPAPA